MVSISRHVWLHLSSLKNRSKPHEARASVDSDNTRHHRTEMCLTFSDAPSYLSSCQRRHERKCESHIFLSLITSALRHVRVTRRLIFTYSWFESIWNGQSKTVGNRTVSRCFVCFVVGQGAAFLTENAPKTEVCVPFFWFSHF